MDEMKNCDQSDLPPPGSEALAWELIEALGQGLTILDRDGSFTYVNLAYAQMIGRPREELIGRKPIDFTHPDDHDKLSKARQRRLSGEQSIYETRLVRPDGRLVYAHVTGMPRWEENNVVGSYTIITDLTEKKRAEQALRQSLDRYLLAIEAVELGIFESNVPPDEHSYFNERWANIMGYTLAELPEAAERLLWLWQRAHPDDVEPLLSNYRALVEGRLEIYEMEARLKHKSGEWIWVRGYIKVTERNGQGIATRILGAILDITDGKRARRLLQENAEKLQLFIEHAPTALAMLDKQMRYLSASKRWLTKYHSDNQNIIGQSFYDVFPASEEEWKKIHQRALVGEVVKDDEYKFVRQDGRVQWLRWEVRPWYSADNTIGGIVIFTEDITERVQIREALFQSENRYRAIVEDQTELIMRSKADGTILFANQAYGRLFNKSPVALEGQNFITLLDKPKQEIVRAKFKRLTPENPVEVDEYREPTPDGSLLWLRWTDRGIFDAAGQLIEVQGVGIDITERREAEELLRQSEAQLQHVIDTVPEGVLLLTADGTIQLTNPIAEKYLGVLAPNRTNDRISHLGERPLEQLLTSPPHGLWHDIHSNGQIFEAIARPVENTAYNAGWVLVIRNVTEEREIQQRVQRQERLAAVGQLAAGIAHDFNNIMSVIVLYAQLVTRTANLSSAHTAKLATIEQQANRATDLIQQILDFARRAVLEKQSLDLLPLMKEQVKLLKRTLPEHIRIKLNHTDEAYLVHADPARIQQVIMNLTLNARDAMPEGGQLHIRLAYLHTEKKSQPPVKDLPPGEWIYLQISDSGPGIPANDLPHIFEPFFTTKQVGKGTGLGLAQVYGIVQQHDGHIDVTTGPGQGTTFHICFPTYAVGDGMPAMLDKAALVWGKGQTVLLVEDEPATRQAIVDSLLMLNYSVVEAKNGGEAITILKTQADQIAVVLSDVIMPDMGGIALLHAIRQQQLTLPVILMSGHPFHEEVENLKGLGLSGWLPKPPNVERLSHLLAQSLNLH